MSDRTPKDPAQSAINRFLVKDAIGAACVVAVAFATKSQAAIAIGLVLWCAAFFVHFQLLRRALKRERDSYEDAVRP
ncbi:MAG: hypothetical protein AAGC56_03430 [Pseudomonadota bacterium]